MSNTNPLVLDFGLVRFVLDIPATEIAEIVSRVFRPQAIATASIGLETPPKIHRIELADGGVELFELAVDGETVHHNLRPNWATYATISLVSDFLIEAISRNSWALHAGAFGLDGFGFLVPGGTKAGKSTTTAIFAAAGYQCYSDDVTIIDDGFRLVKFPRAVVLRNGGWDVLRKFTESADRFLIWGNAETESWYLDIQQPPTSTGREARASFILLPTRDEEGPVLQPANRGEVVALLAEHSFLSTANPRTSLDGVVNMVRNADCYYVNMSQPERAVEAVARLI